MNITGTIENWYLSFCPRPVVCGTLENDTKKRNFTKEIHTSHVNINQVFKEGAIIKTKNSTYLFGKHHPEQEDLWKPS